MIKLIKRLFKIKRYFIVSYTFNTFSGKSGNGSICIYTNGGYVYRQTIKQNIKYKDTAINYDTIVVNNIIELSKSDYYDYCKRY